LHDVRRSLVATSVALRRPINCRTVITVIIIIVNTVIIVVTTVSGKRRYSAVSTEIGAGCPGTGRGAWRSNLRRAGTRRKSTSVYDSGQSVMLVVFTA